MNFSAVAPINSTESCAENFPKLKLQYFEMELFNVTSIVLLVQEMLGTPKNTIGLRFTKVGIKLL